LQKAERVERMVHALKKRLGEKTTLEISLTQRPGIPRLLGGGTQEKIEKESLTGFPPSESYIWENA
jgi:hypothetical protein